MEKEFVSYEIAIALKELGFDEQCLAWHNSKRLFIENFDNCNSKMPFEYCCSLPLKQQVFRWFREKYCLYANLYTWIHEEEKGIYYEFDIYGNPNGVYGDGDFKTYEEAENACIDKLIELAKQQ